MPNPSLRRKVLIVTTEMPAGYGQPTAGGGLRAWSLAEGLKQAGFEVAFSLAEFLLEGRELPEELCRFAHRHENLNTVVRRAAPDILLFEQWFPLSYLEPTDIPVIVDLPGPLVLENSLRAIGSLRSNASLKLRALHRADMFLCTTEKQRPYWIPWLLLAGVPTDQVRLGVVPVSLPPEPPLGQQQAGGEVTFHYGGIFWPWQNPFPALRVILRSLEQHGRGTLSIRGGRHPYHTVQGEKYNLPEEVLTPSPRLAMKPLTQLEELFTEYRQGGVAVDLMEPNLERELACATRDIGYLWCGLPLLVNDYSYLAPMVREYDAGWVIPVDRPELLDATVNEILAHPEEVARRGKNAQRLARDRFTWPASMAALVEQCTAPRKVAPDPTYAEELVRRDLEADEMERQLRQRLADLQHATDDELRHVATELGMLRYENERLREVNRDLARDLESIRGKLPFRVYKKLEKLIKF